MLLAAGAFAFPIHVLAGEGENQPVTFLGDKELTIQLDEGGNASFSVEVLNNVEKESTLTLEIIDLATENEGLVLTDVVSFTIISTGDSDIQIPTEAGKTQQFEIAIQITDQEAVKKTYTAQLAAYGSAGGNALRDLKIIPPKTDTDENGAQPWWQSLLLQPAPLDDEQKKLEENLAGNWWERLKRFFSPYVKALGEFILFLAIGIAIFAFVKYRVIPGFKKFRVVRLDIQDFDHESISTEGHKVGKALSEMIKGALQSTMTPKPNKPIPLIETPADELPTENLDLKISGISVKFILDIIEWLFPPNVIVLNGHLLPAGERGIGLSLELIHKRTGKVEAQNTFWQASFDPDFTAKAPDKVSEETEKSNKEKNGNPYFPLVEPATIWIIYKFHEINEPESAEPPINWQSMAYHQVGTTLFRASKEKQARQMFAEALNQGSNNYYALLNLGFIDSEFGNYEHAIERINEGLQTISKKEPAWYKAMYSLAATYDYFAAEKDENNQDEIEKALCISHNLLTTIYSKQSNDDETLGKFLDEFELVALFLGAAIEVRATEKKIQISLKKDEPTKYISEVNKLLAEKSKITRLHYRARYNLVCYLTTLADKLDEVDAYDAAIKHLPSALERGGGIVTWAQTDPSLKPLRSAREDQFFEIVNASSVKDGDIILHPFDQLPGMKSATIKKMQDEKIFSRAEFLLRGQNPTMRTQLSRKLNIPLDALLYWLNLSDLMRIPEINIHAAVLLEEVGVDTIPELAQRNEQNLFSALEKANNKKQSIDELTLEKVKKWIEQAKTLERTIFY
jgi:tetratricopeptide (TPR) repeat protein